MKRYLTMSALIVTLAAGAAYVVTTQTGGSSLPDLGSANAQSAAEVDTSTIKDMALGPADAAVTVVEYASYTCPHCANFHDTVFDDLKKNYIDTGKIRFIYREVYFDRFGLWASMVARCGGEMRFFGISEILYDQQRDWTRGEAAEIAGSLRKIGKTAGMNDEQLDACMQDADQAQTLYAWFQENAERDDIDSTPTFLVNGTKHGNMNYADFAKLLDDELAK